MGLMNLRTLMTGPWATYIEIGLGVSACVASGYVAYRLERGVLERHLAGDAKAALIAEQQARKLDNATTLIASEERDHLDTRLRGTEKVTTALHAAVGTYLPTPAGTPPGGLPAGPGDRVPYDVTVGFGRLHDYAALGVEAPMAPSPGEPLGAASGIGMPSVADTIIGNYGVCHTYEAEIEAWRGWYVRNQKEWDKWRAVK